MKTTTKILIGVVAASMLLGAACMIFLSRYSTWEYMHYSIDTSAKSAQYIPDCTSLEINPFVFPHSVPSKTLHSRLFILSPTDSAQCGKLVYPAEIEPFIHTQKRGETLVLTFTDVDSIFRIRNSILVDSFYIYYYPARLTKVENKGGLQIDFSGFCSGESLAVKSKGRVDVKDSCLLARLIVEEAEALNLSNSKVDTLDVFRDSVSQCAVEHCRIFVENVFASGHFSVDLPRSQTPQLNWHPMGEQAGLTVKLSGTPAQILYKE